MTNKVECPHYRGMTLLEALIAVAIMAVLMGLLLPAVQRVRSVAQQAACENNLRQIGLGLQSDHQTRGHLPPGYAYNEDYEPPGGVVYNTNPGWGWAAHLLPHLEQSGLAEQILWEKAVEHKDADFVRTRIMKVFVCPADIGAGLMEVMSQENRAICEAATNSYAASFGYGGPIGEQPTLGTGLFYRNSRTRFSDISDGQSATLAVGERAAYFCPTPWAGAVTNGTARSNANSPSFLAAIEEAPVMVLARTLASPLNHDYSSPYDFYSPHSRVAIFLFADGSVRALRFDLSAAVLKAIGTRSGGESLSENDI